MIDADEIHRRWPIFEPAPDTVGLVEVQAGSIRIDRAIEAHLLVAERHGSMLEFGRRVVDWRPAGDGGFEVEDANGAVVGAAHLVLTAGPWLGAILPDLHLPLQVERECPCWFSPTVDPASVGADRLPVWVMMDGGAAFDGKPHDPEFGLNVSIHHWGTYVDPDEVDRVVEPEDVERIRSFLRVRMPSANGPGERNGVLYTNTPDERFIIDRHPAADGVAFASACSGHGFKFAPVIGDILPTGNRGHNSWQIDAFRAGRFASN